MKQGDIVLVLGLFPPRVLDGAPPEGVYGVILDLKEERNRVYFLNHIHGSHRRWYVDEMRVIPDDEVPGHILAAFAEWKLAEGD